MEILSDRYFMLEYPNTIEGRIFYGYKPYLAHSYVDSKGRKCLEFNAENGTLAITPEEFDGIIIDYELQEVDVYKCPCCKKPSLEEIVTDYIRGGVYNMPTFYVKDEVQHIRVNIDDEYHYFGFKIDYCPVCGGKV